MWPITDYVFVVKERVGSLETEVKKFLDKGFVLHGNPGVVQMIVASNRHSMRYFQALIKYEEHEESAMDISSMIQVDRSLPVDILGLEEELTERNISS